MFQTSSDKFDRETSALDFSSAISRDHTPVENLVQNNSSIADRSLATNRTTANRSLLKINNLSSSQIDSVSPLNSSITLNESDFEKTLSAGTEVRILN